MMVQAVIFIILRGYLFMMKSKILIEELKSLLEQARAEIKAGKCYTQQQVKARLGIK